MNFPLIRELLAEQISTSALGSELRSTILKELPKYVGMQYRGHYKEMPFYAYVKDSDIPTPDDTKGKELVKEWITGWLETKMVEICRRNLKRADREVSEYKVKFAKFASKTTNGSCDSTNRLIKINEKYLTQMIDGVYSELHDSFVDTGYEVIQPTLERCDHIIQKIASIFVHEIAHAFQDIRNNHVGLSDSYRSYIEKNKKKFHEIVSKDEKTVGEDKAYLGSPEEIDAFAQQAAYDMIKDFDFEDDYDQAALIADAMKWLDARYTRYASIHGTKDRTEQKILKRYYKKLYKELDKRKDEAIARLKAAEKKQKDDAAHQAAIDDWLKEMGIDDIPSSI